MLKKKKNEKSQDFIIWRQKYFIYAIFKKEKLLKIKVTLILLIHRLSHPHKIRPEFAELIINI